MALEIHFYAGSDIGKVRSANEDSFINEKISDEEYLFAVADGMGGHLAGDVASKLACERFLESYKSSRKKKHPISEALSTAIRRANQAILKKSEDDPLKKGMGTTFTAMITHRMKATIVHVGDSRLYFIRNNQMKRLTTDHTFVEKLVEDGRISPNEARDHPQKNVLYMSLGARDGLVPEMIDDFSLEDGDAFILCTDGLSNLVTENQMKEIVLSRLPEDAAVEMIRAANDSGGTDNITLQIVRIGSIESLEKTKPVKISKPRKNWITVLSILGFCLVLVFFWVFYKGQIEGSSTPGSPEEKKSIPSSLSPYPVVADEVKEISAEVLRDKNFSLADFRFSANQKLFIIKERNLFIFDMVSTAMSQYSLKPDQQVIPSASGDLFFFGRNDPLRDIYELSGASDQTRAELNLRGTNGQLVPVFLSEGIFLFHDATNIYVVKEWKRGISDANMFFPISEIKLSERGQIGIKRIANDYLLTYYHPEAKSVMVFSIGKNFARVSQLENLAIDQPLALEYYPDHSLAFYFVDHSVCFRDEGRKTVDRYYRFPAYKAHIAKILVDIETGSKILVADNQRLYLLS